MKMVVYSALGIAGAGVVFAVALYFYAFGSLGFGNQEAFALFGDFIGGLLNPILGFATILILLRSLWLQNEEMKATRKELEYTRNEMAATRQVHANELELQARNHLRPQMRSIFAGCHDSFEQAWDKLQLFSGPIESRSGMSSFSILHSSKVEDPTQNFFGFWDEEFNRVAAYEMRTLFSALWRSAVALVEYSDTSLETDEVRHIFAGARQRMLDLDLQDEARLERELQVLEETIAHRQGRSFPVVHQAVRT